MWRWFAGGPSAGAEIHALWAQLSVTPLEDRRVLSLSPVLFNADTQQLDLSAGSLAGDQQADTFRLMRQGDELLVAIDGQEVFRARWDSVAQINVHGSTDQDTLIVDLSGGPLLCRGGVDFQGGGSGTGTDALLLQRGAATEPLVGVDYQLSSPGSGSVTVGAGDGTSHITFHNVQALADESHAAQLSFQLDGGAAWTIADAGRPADGVSQITGNDGRTIRFASPADALTIVGSGFAADSQLTLEGLDAPAAREITLDAGRGTLCIAGRIDAAQADAQGHGGSIALLGDHVHLLAQARIDASGDAGGGTILVGGGYQGRDPWRHNAATTEIDAGATLAADARQFGAGGTIIVWSELSTRCDGALSARGGLHGGDGGFAEISSHRQLTHSGAVDVRAPQGHAGTLLLDPESIIIRGGVNDGSDDPDTASNLLRHGANPPGSVLWTDTPTPFVIYESELENTDADIILQATGGISVDGTFTGGLTLMANRSLTLQTRNDAGLGDAAAGINLVTGATGFAIITSGVGTISIHTGVGAVTPQSAAITLGPMTSAGMIDISAAQGNITFTGDATAGSGLSAGTGDGNITGAGLLKATGTIALHAGGGGLGTLLTPLRTTAGGGYVLSTSGVGATGDIYLRDEGPGFATSQIKSLSTAASPQSIQITAANGNLVVDGDLNVGGDSLLLRAAAGDIQRTAGMLTAAKLTLDAQGGIGTTGAVYTSSDGLSLISHGLGAAGDITVSAAHGLVLDQLATDPTQQTVGLTVATGDLTLGSATLGDGADNITLIASDGRILGSPGQLRANSLSLRALGAGGGLGNATQRLNVEAATYTLETAGLGAAGNMDLAHAGPGLAASQFSSLTTSGAGTQTVDLRVATGNFTADANLGVSSDNLAITVAAGDVLGAGGVLVAQTLTLDAAGGIGGAAQRLATLAQTYNLATAGVAAAGNIVITHQGMGLNTAQFATLATAASIQTIDLAVAQGDFTVAAAGLNVGSDALTLRTLDGSILNSGGTLGAGSLTLSAGGNTGGIGQAAAPILANCGSYALETFGNGAAGDIYLTHTGVGLNTNQFSSVATHGTGTQTVEIVLPTGDLVTGGNLGAPDDNLRLRVPTGQIVNGGGVLQADLLGLHSRSGIGSLLPGGAVETTVTRLVARLTAAGDISLHEADELVIGAAGQGLTTVSGDIRVVAGGAVQVTEVVAAGGNGSVSLGAQTGDLQLFAPVRSSSVAPGDGQGTIALGSGGRILSDLPLAVEATAGEALLQAGVGIGTPLAPLSIHVATLAGQSLGAGGVYIRQNDQLTIGSVMGVEGLLSAAGPLDLALGGNLTIARPVVAAAAVNLAIDGELTIQKAPTGPEIQGQTVQVNLVGPQAAYHFAPGVLVRSGTGQVSRPVPLLQLDPQDPNFPLSRGNQEQHITGVIGVDPNDPTYVEQARNYTLQFFWGDTTQLGAPPAALFSGLSSGQLGTFVVAPAGNTVVQSLQPANPSPGPAGLDSARFYPLTYLSIVGFDPVAGHPVVRTVVSLQNPGDIQLRINGVDIGHVEQLVETQVSEALGMPTVPPRDPPLRDIVVQTSLILAPPSTITPFDQTHHDFESPARSEGVEQERRLTLMRVGRDGNEQEVLILPNAAINDLKSLLTALRAGRLPSGLYRLYLDDPGFPRRRLMEFYKSGDTLGDPEPIREPGRGSNPLESPPAPAAGAEAAPSDRAPAPQDESSSRTPLPERVGHTPGRRWHGSLGAAAGLALAQLAQARREPPWNARVRELLESAPHGAFTLAARLKRKLQSSRTSGPRSE